MVVLVHDPAAEAFDDALVTTWRIPGSAAVRPGRNLMDLVGMAALREPVVSAATIRVNTLSAPLTSLEGADVLAALRRPADRPLLTGPPLTEDEWAVLAAHA